MKKVKSIDDITVLGRKVNNVDQRVFIAGIFSAIWNVIYRIFHLVLAIINESSWYAILFIYYIGLGLMRFMAISLETNNSKTQKTYIMRSQGIAFIFLALLITIIVYLDFTSHIIRSSSLIVLILVACFTFSIFVMAIINTIKAHKTKLVSMICLRNISLASALVSMLSLERSMLGTFNDETSLFNYKMKGWTGLGVVVIIVIIGISMIIESKNREYN